MRVSFFLFFCLMSFFPLPVAQASDDKQTDIGLFFNEEEMVISPTRHPKKISYAAESISIVTAEEIRMMNAHTLADILSNVSGVIVLSTGGPGSVATMSIQASETRHVTVFIDGVALNNLSDNVVDIGSFPVQNIARIEVIKGPASSAWGSALGGIVNIITKTGDTQTSFGGTVSGSYGERNTGDYRAEVFGKKGAFAYYLDAGELKTNGFRSHNRFSGNNMYASLSYDVSPLTKIRFTFGHNKTSAGLLEDRPRNLIFDNSNRVVFSSLSLTSKLNNETEADISFRTSRLLYGQFINALNTGTSLDKSTFDDRGYGVSSKITWHKFHHEITAGFDYDFKKLISNKITAGQQSVTKAAFYANDTLYLNHFSITPGLRYDYTDTNGDFVSPSIGITYEPAKNVILRALIAKGFTLPSLASTFGNSLFTIANPDLQIEKVWSYQVGVETSKPNAFWVKVMAFWNDVDDVLTGERLSPQVAHTVNGGKQRRDGIEVDFKTVPVYNVTLNAAATFIETTNVSNTLHTTSNLSQYIYNLGLKYDNKSWFKAVINGRYLWLNFDSSLQGKYNGFIFDINLVATPPKIKNNSCEIFLNIHNAFNGSQYFASIYKNPARWVESGIRYSF